MVFDNLDEAFRYTRVLNATRIINIDKQEIIKYENMSLNLLNDNDKIIDFNIAKLRVRKRDIYE